MKPSVIINGNIASSKRFVKRGVILEKSENSIELTWTGRDAYPAEKVTELRVMIWGVLVRELDSWREKTPAEESAGVTVWVAPGRIELPSQGRKPRVLPLNDEAEKVKIEK